ncbi:hypothetical protein SARC_03465 [Sphaeroforma arctica JP610]|uniref:Uncharacterized protein n=1 Tax=Sphaeroforma arctica JP610 TaxID=667725 RepID=A0A0L0G5S4_9EUKA|nr:hypothetical protein SARC_03465 [Sphaeroforma arctica JP610]KNC84304.1 hypothetical protein SARC_03465 [Sphaeroforma arctica JP610]|eukprot:XP_014158206.1 hypothetical protein SARC_03465 [Sphaeroforma arctica JP610]
MATNRVYDGEREFKLEADRAKEAQRARANKIRKRAPELAPGSLVKFKSSPDRPKSADKWKGPATVRSHNDPVTYTISFRGKEEVDLVFTGDYEQWLFMRSPFSKALIEERRAVLHHLRHTEKGQAWKGLVISAFGLLQKEYTRKDKRVKYNLSPAVRKFLPQEWKKLFPGTFQSRMSLVGSALAFAQVPSFRAEEVKEWTAAANNRAHTQVLGAASAGRPLQLRRVKMLSGLPKAWTLSPSG